MAAMTWATIAAWAALLLGVVGTFLVKGALWSWDPVELWRLSLALLYALLVHGRQPRTSGLRRAVAYLIALAFSLFILFGVRSLVRLLGLPSRFIS
jgi:ABC-type transport system involved in cytochrome c biogenesis permease subunit